MTASIWSKNFVLSVPSLAISPKSFTFDSGPWQNLSLLCTLFGKSGLKSATRAFNSLGKFKRRVGPETAG